MKTWKSKDEKRFVITFRGHTYINDYFRLCLYRLTCICNVNRIYSIYIKVVDGNHSNSSFVMLLVYLDEFNKAKLKRMYWLSTDSDLHNSQML